MNAVDHKHRATAMSPGNQAGRESQQLMADVRERVDTVVDTVSLVCSLLPVIRNRELGGRQTTMMDGEKATHRKRQLADGYLQNKVVVVCLDCGF